MTFTVQFCVTVDYASTCTYTVVAYIFLIDHKNDQILSNVIIIFLHAHTICDRVLLRRVVAGGRAGPPDTFNFHPVLKLILSLTLKSQKLQNQWIILVLIWQWSSEFQFS